MLWSWVPELWGHVLRQALVTWLAMAAMAAVFFGQPTVVHYTHDLLVGQGLVQSGYDQRVLAHYFTYGWWSLALAWIMLETGGFVLVWRYRAKPHEHAQLRERLRQLAEKAGLPKPTLIVLRGIGRALNAAATQSILSGPKVIMVGNIEETLSEVELAYVTAHELSHIKHYDVVAGVLIGAGNSAIAIQKWAIVATMGYDLLAFGWGAFAYLAATWVALSLTHALYKLLAAAHSRSREYLADVGAVRIAGWPRRVSLITGLAHVHHSSTRWQPFRIFRRTGTVLSTHPDIVDRAEALRLETRVLADRNVQVGDVVISTDDVARRKRRKPPSGPPSPPR